MRLPCLTCLTKLNWEIKVCALLLLLVVTAITSPAQTFTTLHSFGSTDGANSHGALVQATDGNFYGTTYAGGANDFGTVFKVNTTGAVTTLYSFCAKTGCTDGSGPAAPLIQAINGNLYGTTYIGGANGYGTVFQITTSGTLTTLYSFCAQSGCADGAEPTASLVQAANGNLYGTTYIGGLNGDGTIFEITPSGTLTTLYSFCAQNDCTDGEGPFGGLVQAANGNLYGTTHLGGANGAGTVFDMTATGTLTTLYSFCAQSGCTDGGGPFAALVQAANGNFYGTTYGGGANAEGTVFQMTPSGTLTTLYSFCALSNCTDGSGPFAALIRATNGNFYGTTYSGGASGEGTIFKVTPTGTLTTLHSFCAQTSCTDGEYAQGALVQSTNGTFYGTTEGGGTNLDGTVFSLSVGLGPFVELQPSSGKVGAAARILGTSLTGATSVSFNGTAAKFTVVSSSEITTTVPAGAVTGFVTVKTPLATLKSNKQFTVQK